MSLINSPSKSANIRDDGYWSDSSSLASITIDWDDEDRPEEGFFVLPLDVIAIIMYYLTMPELGKASQVCKYWRSLCFLLIERKCFPTQNTKGRRIKLPKCSPRSLPQQSSNPENKEYSIIVLGSGASGKSCLIRRLIQNTYIEKYDPTIEDTYKQRISVDNQMCMLNIVDTGVGEYQNLTDCYIKAAEGMMVLFSINSRTSFDYAAKIRRRILELKKDSSNPRLNPIILVGTKLDLERDRVVSRTDGQRMANEWNPEYYRNYFELTSTETQPIIAEAFKEIVRQIDEWRTPLTQEGYKNKCKLM